VYKPACVVTVMVLAVFACLVSVFAQTKRLTASEAKDHLGEVATVCGTVASARYADRTNGHPTFLNLDEPYPHQTFTILIWGNDRVKFGTPETKYRNKRICVTGLIRNYRDAPEMTISNPTSLQLQN